MAPHDDIIKRALSYGLICYLLVSINLLSLKWEQNDHICVSQAFRDRLNICTESVSQVNVRDTWPLAYIVFWVSLLMLCWQLVWTLSHIVPAALELFPVSFKPASVCKCLINGNSLQASWQLPIFILFLSMFIRSFFARFELRSPF